MGDIAVLARAEEFEKKANKKLRGWRIFGSKHKGAAELFNEAANSYKLSKSWDKAGATYTKLANCYLKTKHKIQAAKSYEDAARSYEDAARCHIYEEKQCMEYMVIEAYEKAAELFEEGGVLLSASKCNQKAAQYAARIYQYAKAIEIYGNNTRHILSNRFLKYQAKMHLLEAGICRICLGDDVVLIASALEQYNKVDAEFSKSWKGEFLAAVAASVAEKDYVKFNYVVNRFDDMTPLDSLGCTLLLRVREKLKPKQRNEFGTEKCLMSVRTKRSISTKY